MLNVFSLKQIWLAQLIDYFFQKNKLILIDMTIYRIRSTASFYCFVVKKQKKTKNPSKIKQRNEHYCSLMFSILDNR